MDKTYLKRFEIIKVANYDEMSKLAALTIKDVINLKPNAILGLATGSSPVGTYKELIKMCNNKDISFKDVSTYNLDEYCNLELNHPQSYYTFMYENLFNYVDINKNNVYIPSSQGNDLKKNCQDYNEALEKIAVDLQLLGIGANGHIGFNEPNTPFNKSTWIVKLTKNTREANKRFFENDINLVPKYSITMGIKNILKAKKILLLISGESKRDALVRLLSGEVSTKFPASALNLHSNVTVIVDEAAAKLIKN